jgi:hypothetical protein
MLRASYRTLVIVLCLAFVWLAFSPNASAQRFDKGTRITMNTPFQVPGKTLPAGEYVIRLMEIEGNRRVVQILNATEQKSYAIALGIPDYFLKAPENTHLSFYEVDRGKPLPVHAWFYPGSNFGVEFVYPKTQALEIAAVSGEHVIATTEPEPIAAPTPAELESEPLLAIEPSGEEATLAEVHPEPEAAPPEVAPAEPVQTAQTLPRTATPFPLFALTGLLAAGAAGALRVMRRSRS